MGEAPAAARAPRARRRATGLAVALAVVAVVGAVAFVALRGDGSPPAAGVTDPAAWDLPRLNGPGRVRLEDFRGTPLVVNFFATWCVSCRFELPAFATVSRELEGKVAFVGVNSLELGDGMTMAREFGVDHWPIARDVGGQDGSGLHDAVGARGMPASVFYDERGEIVEFVGGAMSERTLRAKLREHYGAGV